MNTEDPIDSVNLEIPLLIRLFEYSREDATSDKDLHVVAENLVKCSKECEGKPLTMECYDKVVPQKTEEAVNKSDTMEHFISYVKGAYEVGKEQEKLDSPNSSEVYFMKGELQRATMIGKRLAAAMKNKEFSQAVSEIESASIQPDFGDKLYHLEKAVMILKRMKVFEESTVAGDVAGKDVSLFSGKDKVAKIKSVAEAVRMVIEKKLPVDIGTKIENAKKLDPKKLEAIGGKYDLDITMKVVGKSVEFEINGSVGGHEDLNVLGAELRDLVDGTNFFYNYGLKKSRVQVVF